METIQFLNYSPQQLQGKITTSVKKRLKKQNLKRKNNPLKKSQETVKIIKVILKIYCYLAQPIEPYILHNYHQEISNFLYFAKKIFVKWLL